MPEKSKPELRAYCEQCEEVVVVEQATEDQTNTGKKFVRGRCPKCGGALYALPAPKR